MISFERAGEILDEALDALPEGICADLNGGVNLLRETRRTEDGRYTMGLYHNDSMGRYVEIFYGSFAAVHGGKSDGEIAEELVKTLHHELTHHVESKAGDRTLERWDEEQTLLWQQRQEEAAAPLRADSVLFAGGEPELPQAACQLFREEAEARGLPVRCGWSLTEEVTEDLAAGFDAILCMTMEQAEALAERFPALDEKLLCLGEKDILPPLKRCRRQLLREVRYLAEELGEAGEDGQ